MNVKADFFCEPNRCWLPAKDCHLRRAIARKYQRLNPKSIGQFYRCLDCKDPAPGEEQFKAPPRLAQRVVHHEVRGF